MPFVRKNTNNDQGITASAYVGCVYAHVASENQPAMYKLGLREQHARASL